MLFDGFAMNGMPFFLENLLPIDLLDHISDLDQFGMKFIDMAFLR
jgi:hypothetical protein